MIDNFCFGYWPEEIGFESQYLQVSVAENFSALTRDINASEHDDVRNGWIYAPHLSRIFGLHHTHSMSVKLDGMPEISKLGSKGIQEYVEFNLWVLSLFKGIKLTNTERGYLDATPIRINELNDFIIKNGNIPMLLDLAHSFFKANLSSRQSLRFNAAVNAYFISQNPQLLQYEKFIYLYYAIDTCYKICSELPGFSSVKPDKPVLHKERLTILCSLYNINPPEWMLNNELDVVGLRNNAMHEAIYLEKPLGYAVHSDKQINLILELRNLVCRFLVAIITNNKTSYIQSPVNTRQCMSLNLQI